jgi:TolB-like protein
MMRTLPPALALLLATVPIAAPAQIQESFDAGIARIAENLSQPLVGRTVAVFEFPDLESRVTNLSRLVSEQLTTEMVQQLAGRARVLERRQVVQVLTELNLLRTDLTAAEVSRVGRQLGADAIVLGSATTIGEQIVVNVRAVAVSGGEVLGASRMSVQGSQNFLALAQAGVGAPQLTPASPGSATGPHASPGRPHPAARTSIGVTTVEVTRCTQTGASVVCELTLNNQGPDRRINLYQSSATRIFDTEGNAYPVAQVQIANQDNWSAVLVSGVPTRARLTFRQVAPTSLITLLQIYAYFDDYETLSFRNLPVQ